MAGPKFAVGDTVISKPRRFVKQVGEPVYLHEEVTIMKVFDGSPRRYEVRYANGTTADLREGELASLNEGE